ncbi:unnamed protein product [Notodromas monacha]|uniref:NADH dehydrogenase [ubiquinone] 1 alpha subcomplex assembly factor 2 n=1 Tax=Notodromas monacha TaxID=399045 RepID=A0A7R9GHP8_9CRUS|nr:unnamed protein product [Notodromas monacha]CAG0921721.1 unnamed protein product [Notodromas monacha]
MAQRPPRNIFKIFWNNFTKSIRPRQVYSGDSVGKDRFGNEYFEIPADPSSARRLPRRWFKPRTDFNFEAEMPAEWEAWLRFRRKIPPSEEELDKNYKIMMQTKANARVLAERDAASRQLGSSERLPDIASPQSEDDQMKKFPKYGDYELFPGQKMEDERKDKG